MLRREELLMCGRGVLSGWEASQAGRDEEVPEGAFRRAPRPKESQPRRVCWHHRRRGRTPRFSRAHGRQHYQQHYQQQQQQQQGRLWPRGARPRVLLSLRPVNLLGKRAPGMRAPRNTNQFLMGEKYRLLHLRSDSLGTESGGSDCEADPPLDMDSYLGALENARGALADGPPPAAAAQGSPAPPASPPRAPPAGARPAQPRGLEGALQEESLQYFPSEDDVIENELFMERDFQEFCSRIA